MHIFLLILEFSIIDHLLFLIVLTIFVMSESTFSNFRSTFYGLVITSGFLTDFAKFLLNSYLRYKNVMDFFNKHLNCFALEVGL